MRPQDLPTGSGWTQAGSPRLSSLSLHFLQQQPSSVPSSLPLCHFPSPFITKWVSCGARASHLCTTVPSTGHSPSRQVPSSQGMQGQP